MNIGVLGGTFNPIHNGHLMMAEETRERLDLVEVLFIPAGQPWLKERNPILSTEHRVQMVRLAIADRPWFKLSTIEIDRPGSCASHKDAIVPSAAQRSAELAPAVGIAPASGEG